MIYASNNNIIKTGGRLGNSCMRIMSLMGLSLQYNTTFAIPDWDYAKYFENDIPQKNDVKVTHILKEPFFHYNDRLLYGFDHNKVVIDLMGFFQSPRYWVEKLKFKSGYANSLKRKYDISNNSIAISARLCPDMTENKCYHKVPPEYYTSALLEHFPDYKERQVFIFSDDFIKARKTFDYIENAVYVDASDIEQLAVLTLCKNFIISQSTFSFVGAYLADAEKVIRPLKNFSGDYAQKNNEKDFWPALDNWEIYDYEKQVV